MKKNVLLLFLSSLVAISVSVAQERGQRQGQQNRSPEERAKMQVERLHKSLVLDKPQQDSIYKYAVEQAKEQQALFQNGDADRAKRMEQISVISTKYDTKFKSFLKAEQLTAYDKLQKERQERRRQQSDSNN